MITTWCDPKFLNFKLPNVSNKDALSIRKRLLRCAINKRNKELQHLSKELSLSKNFLRTQLSTIVLQNHRKNKDIVITKPDNENEVVILDRKLYNNAIE